MQEKVVKLKSFEEEDSAPYIQLSAKECGVSVADEMPRARVRGSQEQTAKRKKTV